MAGSTDPADGAFAVTPHDTNANKARALWIGTGGNVAVVTRRRTTAVTFVNVPDGTMLPVQVDKVMSTNTTASDILGLT